MSIESVWTQKAIAPKVSVFTFEQNGGEELDLMLLAMFLIKKKQKRSKRKVWVKDIYKNRETLGIDRLVNEMQLQSREAYFK